MRPWSSYGPKRVPAERSGTGLNDCSASVPRSSSERPLNAILATSVPIVVAGVSLLAKSGGGLYWVLAAIVLPYISGIGNAWVLLVEVVREGATGQRPSPNSRENLPDDTAGRLSLRWSHRSPAKSATSSRSRKTSPRTSRFPALPARSSGCPFGVRLPECRKRIA